MAQQDEPPAYVQLQSWQSAFHRKMDVCWNRAADSEYGGLSSGPKHVKQVLRKRTTDTSKQMTEEKATVVSLWVTPTKIPV